MSVINQMLNDLDNRKDQPVKQAHKLLAHPLMAHPDDNQMSWKWGLLFSNLLLIAAVCVFAYWYVQQQQETKQSENHLIPITLATQIQSDNTHDVNLVPMNAYINDEAPIDLVTNKETGNTSTKAHRVLADDIKQRKEARISSNMPKKDVKSKKVESQPSVVSEKQTSSKPKRPVLLAQNSSPESTPSLQQENQPVPLQASTQFSMKEVHLSKKELSRKFYEEAESLKQQGSLVKALPKYQASLQSFSKNKAARQELAAVLVTLGQYDQAMSTLQQGIELFPHDSGFSFSLVHLQGKLGLYDQAMSVLTEMNARGDELIRKHSLALSLAKKSNNLPLQRDSYRALSLLEPDQGRWWMGWAHMLDKEGKQSQAILGYETALLKNNLSKEASIYIQKRLVELKGRR